MFRVGIHVGVVVFSFLNFYSNPLAHSSEMLAPANLDWNALYETSPPILNSSMQDLDPLLFRLQTATSHAFFGSQVTQSASSVTAGNGQPVIWYVNANNPNPGDGLSWATAFNNLELALEASQEDAEIWVAEGTYRPRKRLDANNPRSATFAVHKKKLFGGFIGTETSIADRRGSPRRTILEGDIGVRNFSEDNAEHVVTVFLKALLDGFTIQNGHSSTFGGGIFGAFVYVPSHAGWSGPLILLGNSVIRNNYAAIAGGGISTQLSTTYAKWVAFKDNISTKGGAAHLQASTVRVFNSQFLDNKAVSRANPAGTKGGALYLPSVYWSASAGAAVKVVNSLFARNEAAKGGAAYLTGALYIAGNADWFNSTLTENKASIEGGAVAVGLNTHGNAYPHSTFSNSIIWGNRAENSPGLAGPNDVSYSLLQDTYDGDGNISADPRFRNPEEGNFQLSDTSPAIDSGNSEMLFGDSYDLDSDGIFNEGVPYDLRGSARIRDSLNTPDTGVGDGSNLVVDMGAFEFVRAF